MYIVKTKKITEKRKRKR